MVPDISDIHISDTRYLLYPILMIPNISCLLYTSDAADDTPCVDLGGRRIIKKKIKLSKLCELQTKKSGLYNQLRI